MKNAGRIILIVVVAILLMGSSVQAQLDANQDVNVYAEILDTITIDPGGEGIQDMDFSFGTSPSGGDVEITLGTDGTLTVNAGGAEVFWNDTGSPAIVGVGGRAERSYIVSIEGFEVTPNTALAAGSGAISLTGPGSTLTVDRYLVAGTNVIDSGFNFDPDGLDELTIGAVLTVPAGVVVGDYSGFFNLVVAYE